MQSPALDSRRLRSEKADEGAEKSILGTQSGSEAWAEATAAKAAGRRCLKSMVDVLSRNKS